MVVDDDEEEEDDDDDDDEVNRRLSTDLVGNSCLSSDGR
jgi:hypothetical protein